MDSLDRQLIELKQAILQFRNGDNRTTNEITSVINAVNLDGGDDIVNIQTSGCDCEPGPPGPKGDKGDTGECNCKCTAIVISQDYQATCSDYYIGVNSENPVSITLPCGCDDCTQIIVKAEMNPGIGYRKVTIVPCMEDSTLSTIDGKMSYVMSIPYESVQLIFRDNNWYII